MCIIINFLFNEANPLIILILVGIQIKMRVFQRIVPLPLFRRTIFNFTIKCQGSLFNCIILIFQCLYFSLIMRILSFRIWQSFSWIENIWAVVVFLFVIDYWDLKLSGRCSCSYIWYLVIISRFFRVVLITNHCFVTIISL